MTIGGGYVFTGIHGLVGAGVCAMTGSPVAGGFAAIVSHLALDAGPQLGTEETLQSGWWSEKSLGVPRPLLVTAIEMGISFGLLWLLTHQNPDRFLFWLGGVVGTLPDIFHIKHVPLFQKFRIIKVFDLTPLRQFEQLHLDLHWWIVSVWSPFYWLYVAAVFGGSLYWIHCLAL